jgi:hypothetical protein
MSGATRVLIDDDEGNASSPRSRTPPADRQIWRPRKKGFARLNR